MKIRSKIGLNLELNQENHTAKIAENKEAYGNIVVPRSIFHNSQEYIITEISKDAFKNSTINSLTFSEDSEILTIGKGAFKYSNIQEFSIPRKLQEIDDDCFNYVHYLVKIKNEYNNPNFKILNDNLLLGKSDKTKTIFDVIYFCSRDVTSILIPSHIKEIKSNSFSFCKELIEVKFETESKVEIIGKNSFEFTSIESIILPSSVTTIEEYSFYNCRFLSEIKFEENSKLKQIGKCTFLMCPFADIFLPSELTILSESAFSDCSKLQKVRFAEESKLTTIEKNCFLNTKIEEFEIPANVKFLKERWIVSNALKRLTVSKNNKYFKVLDNGLLIGNNDSIYYAPTKIVEVDIPNTIKHIQPYVFYFASDLIKVNIGEDSILETIGDNAFYHTAIREIFIPKTVKSIGKEAFCDSYKLATIKFDSNSQLKQLGQDAFNNICCDELFIPSDLKDFQSCSKCLMSKIIISENNRFFKLLDDKILIGKSKSDEFDTIYFACRDIEAIIIPSTIKYISDFSLAYCYKLKSIEFSEDSQLIEIGKYSFRDAAIEHISIPNHVKIIDDYAFYRCENLNKIEISENSELKYIGKLAFCATSIEHIFIPKNITTIKESTFSSCSLTDIEFHEDSQLTSIEKNSFDSSDIEKIEIPKSVTTIGQNCFKECEKLKEIIISKDSKLRSIEGEFEIDQNIQNIFIPSCFDTFSSGLRFLLKSSLNFEISENNIIKVLNNKVIIKKSDINSDEFDTLYFVPCDIEKVIIPSTIKFIDSYSFYNCDHVCAPRC